MGAMNFSILHLVLYSCRRSGFRLTNGGVVDLGQFQRTTVGPDELPFPSPVVKQQRMQRWRKCGEWVRNK